MSKQYYSTTYQVKLSDHSLSYTDNGSKNKTVIIFIHGFPFNKIIWKKQIKAFDKLYRVISYDIRGYGYSQPGFKEFSIPQFAEDLIELMNKLKIKKAVLCGLSLGGYIALHAVIHFQNRFTGLVLSDTICTSDTKDIREMRQKSILEIQKNGVAQYINKTLLTLLTSKTLQIKKTALKELKAIMTKTSEETLSKTIQALCNRKETCKQLKMIDIPALILTGQSDRIALPYSVRLMQMRIPNSQFAIVENAGHIANLDNPKAFNEQIAYFIQNLDTLANQEIEKDYYMS